MKILRLFAVACASISALTFSNAAYAAESVKSADGSITFHTGTPYYDPKAASYPQASQSVSQASEDEPITKEEKTSEEKATTQSAVHSFSRISLGTSRPNEMTFPQRHIAYQPYATIDVVVTCDRPSAQLDFELYQYCNSEPVCISSSMKVKPNRGGLAEWSTSYGADGDYAIKIWAEQPCSIAGNLIYQ